MYTKSKQGPYLLAGLAYLLILSFLIYPISSVLAAEENTPPARVISSEPIPESVSASEPNPESSAVSAPEGEPEAQSQMMSEGSQENNPENLTASLTEKRKGILETDQATGALNYSFPIYVPPGRNGLQPSISLDYNSQQANNYPNLIGYGWNISIPYIERINRTGTDKLYIDNYFSSSLGGELVNVSGSTYAPKVENGDFLSYTYNGTSWTMKDKKGTTYKFGQNASTRQDDNTGTKVYKWMLEEVRDTNNNYIKYEYYKDAGQIYPSKIKYTGNGTTDGIFEVEFLRESRTDVSKSYATTFLVVTNYRINQIQTKVNGSWVKKYTLGYTTGDNTIRSLLASITESGQDENAVITTLPAITFEYNHSIPGWTLDTETYTSPTPFGDAFQSMLDMNGDTLPDIVESYIGPANQELKHTYLNNNNGTWTLNNNLQPLVLFRQNEPRGPGGLGDSWDQGVRVVDVNGDLLPDIVKSEENTVGNGGYVTYLNTNGSSWVENNTLYPQTVTINGDDNWYSWGSHLIDLNADGLSDTIRKKNGFFGSQLNNGTEFSPATQAWYTPLEYLQGPFVQFADFNGDTLPDFINEILINYNTTHIKDVYINKGDGVWVIDNSYLVPLEISQSNQDSGVRFFDVNGDGLADAVPGWELTYAGRHVELNTGSGWVAAPGWDVTDSNIEFSGNGNLVNITDVNSDGSIDFFKTQGSNPIVTVAFINNTTTPTDILKKVNFPEGGNTTVNYKKTSKYVDGSGNLLNPNFPIPLDTVYQTITNDGNGNIATDTFSYEGGLYYFNTATDRRPAGFAKVTKTNSVGTKTINYFHQGNATNSALGEYDDHPSKIGKIYRTEITDSAGNIYSKTINKLDRYNQAAGRDFVKLIRTTGETFDGNATHKDSAEEYTYDNANGNLTQKVNWGEVVAGDDGSFSDTGNDKSTENISYVSNSGNNVIGLPYQDTVLDQNSNKVRESKMYYDGLALGSVGVGNETKVENWKTGSTYINTQKVYNTIYGIVSSSKDPKGEVTRYTYDAYNLYPSAISNPLNQKIQYLYDYSAGKPKQVKDPNNFIYNTIFDGLDRVLQEKVPDLNSPYASVVKTQYNYTDTPLAFQIKKTDYLDNGNAVDTHQYFDGLNRVVQERRETENTNSWNVQDFTYNDMGLLLKESLPYVGTGSAKTSPTSINELYTNYIYDPVTRPISTTNAVGTTSYTYDDWKTTTIDPLGKTKSYYKDALDNLVKVDEVNNGATYSTNYEWNLNKNLIKITDTLGNIRNFTYDALGSRLSAEDLHQSGDTSFGTWNYTYDNAGSMIQSISPLADTVNYTYDSLNRPLSEDATGTAGIETTYAYDTCALSLGKLCSANVSGGANTSYTYNSNGAIKTENQSINSTAYNTTYTYDRLGNMTNIIYPDNSEIKNTFNNGGLLEKVERKESGGSFTDVISNFDYSPTNQITSQILPNTVTTTNTYDAARLYRLTRRLTQNNAGTKLQDLNYIYDNVGNITQVTDASNTNSSKTVDYTYDDLYRLLSATATNTAGGQAPYTQTYSYDAVGNILTSPVGVYLYQGNTGALKANPHAATKINGVNQTYDANGNLLTNGTLTNLWNYKNQLTRTTAGSTGLLYYYDYQGNRMRTKKGNINTYYPNKYYNTDGTKKTKQIYAGGMLVATIETVGTVVTPYYVHNDNLGGSSVISDTTGTKNQLLDYFPYGDIRLNEQSSGFDEQRKYIGQIYDTDTGLDYLNARYYKPSTGRFISQDSMFWALPQEVLLDPQQMNSYSYARGNPISSSDPSGNLSMDSLSPKNISNAISSFFSNLFGSNKVNTPQVTAPTATQQPTTKISTTDYPGGAYLTSNKINVTFQNGANNMVNPKAANYFSAIADQASMRGYTSIGISSTTNHTSNSGVSAHEVANGARAFDIVSIDGVHVSSNDPYSAEIQQIIKSTPGYRENYGPTLMDKALCSGCEPNSRFGSTNPKVLELIKQHTNHIHVSVQP